MLKIIILIILFYSLPIQKNIINKNVYQAGETLIYKVSWSIFRLGTVTIQTHEHKDTTHLKLSMHVVSNPHIPFISIDEYNETLIDIYDGMSRSFYARHRHGKDSLEMYRIYNESNRQLVFTLINHSQSKYVQHDTIKNIPLYVDGPSLFFISRALIQSGMEYNIPTIVEKKIENTNLNFEKNIELIDSDLFSAPVRTRRFNGICEWEGGTSAGLSGEFTGWISDDSVAVPIIAKMKILIGSVKLELECFNRTDWIPPLVYPVLEEITNQKNIEESL